MFDRRVEPLQRALSIMARARSLYFLGAGASWDAVPTMESIRAKFVSWYPTFGIYPGARLERAAFVDRLLGPLRETDPDIVDTAPDEGVRAFLMRGLRFPSSSIVPPSYAVFERVGSPFVIVTMNVDGVAALVKARCRLIELHGRIPEAVLAPDWQDIVDACTEYEFPPPFHEEFLPPVPEGPRITANLQYMEVERVWPRTGSMLLVGYSFGTSDRGYDDRETLELVRSLLSWRSKSLVIIDPWPGGAAELVTSANRRARTRLLPVRWNHMTLAILEALHPAQSVLALVRDARQLLYRHDQLADS